MVSFSQPLQQKQIKPVGYEAAIHKRVDGSGLPTFWFMEDTAGCYKSIMSPAKPSGPRDPPSATPSSSKAPAAEAKKKDHASPPASPPSGGLPSAEAYTDQPSGASESSPSMSPAGASSGSWAKIAASAPLPMPMQKANYMSSFDASDAGRAGPGLALLSEWVTPQKAVRA